ncbi:MAG: biotin transporter BioY [Oscillospiraceae bacterium]|jgi:biotin transport system substrate-specific component|nr:biotin transporter BioY [Oscillospiraceae bacterium]
MKFNLRSVVMCGLFAALTAIFTVIMIPLPGMVPITLSSASVFLAGALLGAKYGAASQLAYVLLGAAGLPIFTGQRGGLSALFGPTGGFLLGYILTAWGVGFVSDRLGCKTRYMAPAMALGQIFLTYLPGLLWYMVYFRGEKGFAAAVTACALPFLPGDAIKVAVCSVLSPRLKRLIDRR